MQPMQSRDPSAGSLPHGGQLVDRRLDAEAFTNGRQRHLKEILRASNLLRQRETALRGIE